MGTGPLDPAVLDLEPLELLTSVIELGSMSAAAARHGVSQPAVSARMRNLERRLGLQLLLRTASGSRATTDGLVVARAAEQVLRHAGELAQAVHELRAAQRGALRIASSLTIAEHLLPAWLTALQASGAPMKVELRVENADSVAELILSGQADLGFTEAAAAPAGLDAHVVARDELLVVCTPSHEWASRADGISPEELAATRLVVREQGAGARDLLEHRLAELGIRTVAPIAEIASPSALRAAVAAGVAPGVVSEWAVNDDVATGRLHRVVVHRLDLHRDLRAVWRPGAPPMALRRMLGIDRTVVTTCAAGTADVELNMVTLVLDHHELDDGVDSPTDVAKGAATPPVSKVSTPNQKMGRGAFEPGGAPRSRSVVKAASPPWTR